jgi:hypothetical protein
MVGRQCLVGNRALLPRPLVVSIGAVLVIPDASARLDLCDAVAPVSGVILSWTVNIARKTKIFLR